ASRILVVASFALSLVHFRGDLIRALLKQGHQVICCAPEPSDEVQEVASKLEVWGASYMQVPLVPTGSNVLSDGIYLVALTRLMRRVRPDIVLAYTMKPVIYGTLAAALAGVDNAYCMITGLGYAFTPGPGMRRALIRGVVSCLLHTSLRFARAVVLFNQDDFRFFVSHAFAKPVCKIHVVNGSGVNLKEFAPSPVPVKPFTFLMSSRMLIDKGVREYIDAARIIHARYPEVHFLLVGPPDPNPSGISSDEVAAWIAEGVVKY